MAGIFGPCMCKVQILKKVESGVRGRGCCCANREKIIVKNADVYLPIVGLTDISVLFAWTNDVAFCM
jgi:hypothetical protein